MVNKLHVFYTSRKLDVEKRDILPYYLKGPPSRSYSLNKCETTTIHSTIINLGQFRI